jgi:hypothetical protein
LDRGTTRAAACHAIYDRLNCDSYHRATAKIGVRNEACDRCSCILRYTVLFDLQNPAIFVSTVLGVFRVCTSMETREIIRVTTWDSDSAISDLDRTVSRLHYLSVRKDKALSYGEPLAWAG